MLASLSSEAHLAVTENCMKVEETVVNFKGVPITVTGITQKLKSLPPPVPTPNTVLADTQSQGQGVVKTPGHCILPLMDSHSVESKIYLRVPRSIPEHSGNVLLHNTTERKQPMRILCYSVTGLCSTRRFIIDIALVKQASESEQPHPPVHPTG
jgi:hypothetical protein